MILTKKPYLLGALLIFLFALSTRFLIFSLRNGDLYLIRTWYDFLLDAGYKGLANGDFSNYPPAYLYLLFISTLTSKWLDPFLALKIIPTVFDVLSAIVIYKIANQKHTEDKSIFIASLFFALPTIMFNSSGWGQIDSMYGAFILLCFYLLQTERPFYAMIAFGVAFSFKAQSIFLLPFLGILFLWKRIRWYDFLTLPTVYILMALPAALIGRDWNSILLLYVGQTSQFDDLARNAPNLYSFIPKEFYHPVFEGGMVIFFLSMLFWAWINWKTKPVTSPYILAITALTSTTLSVFLLPKMHDRYFYPADIFALVTAIFMPKLWFLAFLSQLSSGLVYLIFPFSQTRLLVIPAALINTALVIVILRYQIRALKEK